MTRLQIAAAYQILAGAMGLVSTLRPTLLPAGVGIGFNVYAVVLSCFSIGLGILLWSDVVRARGLSFAFQLLQVLQVSLPNLVFSVLIGLEASITIRGELVNAYTTYGVRFLAGIPATAHETAVGVNLVAATIAGILWSARGVATLERTP